MSTSSGVNCQLDMPVYVGLLEVQLLLPRYKNNLLFLKQFIDNVIGVWTDTPGDSLEWTSFFCCLNNWGTLKWTYHGHINGLILLDLYILIMATHQIHFQMYKKEKKTSTYTFHSDWRIQKICSSALSMDN
jgi:hypothetical protein